MRRAIPEVEGVKVAQHKQDVAKISSSKTRLQTLMLAYNLENPQCRYTLSNAHVLLTTLSFKVISAEEDYVATGNSLWTLLWIKRDFVNNPLSTFSLRHLSRPSCFPLLHRPSPHLLWANQTSCGEIRVGSIPAWLATLLTREQKHNNQKQVEPRTMDKNKAPSIRYEPISDIYIMGYQY